MTTVESYVLIRMVYVSLLILLLHSAAAYLALVFDKKLEGDTFIENLADIIRSCWPLYIAQVLVFALAVLGGFILLAKRMVSVNMLAHILVIPLVVMTSLWVFQLKRRYETGVGAMAFFVILSLLGFLAAAPAFLQ